MDVVEVLDTYLHEKTHNLLIQAWYRLKIQTAKDSHKQSLQTFSKSNSSDVQNIIPLTTKNYLRKNKRERFETAEN